MHRENPLGQPGRIAAFMTPSHSSRTALVIGWRELIRLPDIGIAEMHAKIDTGARTSALHAVDQTPFERAGRAWIRFRIPTTSQHDDIIAEAPLVDRRAIRNTSGIPQHRHVINTTLVLGPRKWHMDVSLADRGEMAFDLILGRTAIRRRNILVDPGKSFLTGHPVRKSARDGIIPVFAQNEE